VHALVGRRPSPHSFRRRRAFRPLAIQSASLPASAPCLPLAGRFSPRRWLACGDCRRLPRRLPDWPLRPLLDQLRWLYGQGLPWLPSSSFDGGCGHRRRASPAEQSRLVIGTELAAALGDHRRRRIAFQYRWQGIQAIRLITSLGSSVMAGKAPNAAHHRVRHVASAESRETRLPRSGACACWATPTVSNPTSSSCYSHLFITPAAALLPAFRSPGLGHARPGRKPRSPWRSSPPRRALAALMSQPWQVPCSLPTKARNPEPRRDHATPRLGHALAFIDLAHELHLLSVRGVVGQINPEPIRPEANPRRVPIRSSAMAG
jgi:hypothetical protein